MTTDYQAPWWRSFGVQGKSKSMLKLLDWLVTLLALFVLLAAMLGSCVEGLDRTIDLDTQSAQRSQAMAAEFYPQLAFFDRHGSSDPASMAKAVLATQPDYRPLMAAVAVVESNGHPAAVGDDGKSRGAWQVQPRHWGAVPRNVEAQARQAERILVELVDAVEHRGVLRWREALARYNGGTTPPGVSYCYADRVLMLAWQNVMEGV